MGKVTIKLEIEYAKKTYNFLSVSFTNNLTNITTNTIGTTIAKIFKTLFFSKLLYGILLEKVLKPKIV